MSFQFQSSENQSTFFPPFLARVSCSLNIKTDHAASVCVWGGGGGSEGREGGTLLQGKKGKENDEKFRLVFLVSKHGA